MMKNVKEIAVIENNTQTYFSKIASKYRGLSPKK
jgi:hypothetical protein